MEPAALLLTAATDRATGGASQHGGQVPVAEMRAERIEAS